MPASEPKSTDENSKVITAKESDGNSESAQESKMRSVPLPSAEGGDNATTPQGGVTTSAYPQHWGEYQRRYASGEGRSHIFLDMVKAESNRLSELKRNDSASPMTILDIGCGGGFDHKPGLQEQLAVGADRYVGIEPDPDIVMDDIFTETHRAILEDAPIESNSISLAFSVMVLEHVKEAQLFWDKVYDILEPGGVFWGFTVDSRHWFVSASSLLERMGLKNMYLNVLHGRRGEQRYENYGVYYRSNSPEQIKALTSKFKSVETVSFQKIGQLDFYLPGWTHWFGHMLDRFEIHFRRPGPVIAIRVEK